MALEIERKFLVTNDDWRLGCEGTVYIQGYVAATPKATVRVRVAGDLAYLTLKGKVVDLTRTEFEYPIPVADARQMLQQWCAPLVVEKTRYKIPLGDLVWEVDDFSGLNQGLVVAEVELLSSTQEIVKPAWLGEEVSHDARYYNSSLARMPYSAWSD
ncbi:Inorganic triphosphatase [Acaryochloris thomasi RCC1774]|uniref:Inorganic triphosphatase n=1 Tax=Acaryochloris thomasi RCC1774 TaxID=1764569 RepID=A0A2W1JES4_9CYAN|nr:CYTH domain-containing protein [Acaryochloris thomasi]PZD72260.1 Inorganic triphosphatase [Acaryochloris thomasi RCC1774]